MTTSTFLNPDKRTQEIRLKQFEIRKKAKFCICLVTFIQIIYRIVSIIWDPSLNNKAQTLWIISLPFSLMISVIVSLEYFFFKKKGPSVLKYSNIVDILLLLVFLGDWLTSSISSLFRLEQTDPPSFKISSLYGFTTFSWRTLLITLLVNPFTLLISNTTKKFSQVGTLLCSDGASNFANPKVFSLSQRSRFSLNLMVQLTSKIISPAIYGTCHRERVNKWQLKIIAPVVATFVVTAYAIHYDPNDWEFLLVRAAIQTFNILVIIYCEDKVKRGLMRTNIEQEKWMQVNDFIFDNIPENIIILDLFGEARFMSDYCRAFMSKLGLSSDGKEFFKRVQHLQQYESDLASPSAYGPATNSLLQIEKFTSAHKIYVNLGETEATFVKIETLQDLLINFPNLIKSKNLQEKQFLVYNGKFKAETNQPAKSLEMKISFVHHYENDYIILIFRDTTQRDLIVKLEETNNYKDQLLASVSHELRAPLNGNINLVEGAINSPEIPESLKETLLIPALRSSQFLLHIINDILDMSQIKQKKLRLVFEYENLKETLKSAAQLVELQAKKKGLEFLVELDPALPRKICTDHLRVSQIVLNLLTNAVKFTNQGTVKLIAVPVNDTVQISIQDSGIGICQEDMKKLFSQNAIIDCQEKDQMNPTGAGLGLNIASNLVQLLAPEGQKKIDVVSILNEGSTFTFVIENKPQQQKEKMNKSCSFYETVEDLPPIVLPRVFDKIRTLTSRTSFPSETKKFDSEPLGSNESPQEPLVKHCSCPKVLIVDDNPFNTMALETILNSLKMKSDSAYNGTSALQKLLNRQANTCGKNCKQYSVVFMDQEMPGLSGAETVREIKKLQEENRVSSEMRIIGCTAHKVKEEVDQFLASGLETCIFKPVSIALIKETMGEILD